MPCRLAQESFSFPHAFAEPHLSRHLVLTLALLVLNACGSADAGREPALVLTPVTSPTGGGAAEPNLYATADGRVLMSWLEATGDGGHALKVSVRDSAGGWGTTREVIRRNDLFVNWADFPSVVGLSDGRLLAHWLQKNGGNRYAYEVRLSESRDDGSTWSASVTPHRPGVPAEHGFVTILPTSDGGARIFFLDGGAGIKAPAVPAEPAAAGHAEHAVPMSLSVNSWATGLDDSTKTVLDRRVCDCCQTAAAMTARGPVVIFRDRSESEVRDIAILREIEGDWTAPRPVHEDNWTVDFCPVNGPAIVADGEDVAVAWFNAARDTSRVQVVFSTDAGETFGAPIRVDEGTPAGRVGVQWIGDDVLVSWLERAAGDTAFVKVRRVRRDGTISAPITVSTSSGTRSSGFPRMVRSGDGVILAWTIPGSPSAVLMATLAPAAR